MALTFLTLTNRVLKAFNEVKLNTSNFGTADGFYEEAKDAINQAIFDVHTEEDVKWPWAWGEATFNTVIGEQGNSLSALATVVDWDSFRLLGDDTDPDDPITPVDLPSVNYHVYRRTYWKRDQELTIDDYTKPNQIVRKPDNSVLVTPVPDKVYTIQYEYYTMPTALVNATDTTIIPDEFEQLIVDKALHYAYMFRDNVEQAALAQKRYADNVNRVRRILIPQFQNIVTLG
jgi:hypothetical protein